MNFIIKLSTMNKKIFRQFTIQVLHFIIRFKNEEAILLSWIGK
jgi:hypothetical protein